MKLYNYFRSSASWRVRIALAHKGLNWEYVPIHLAKNEHQASMYSEISYSKLVPLLEDEGHALHQSMAIIEYLEECHPQPPLLPGDAVNRASIRALAQDVACDIHPLNNLRVLRYLVGRLAQSDETKLEWIAHWVKEGFTAIERQLEVLASQGRGGGDSGHCWGAQVTMADLMLIPQVYNARRFGCDLSAFPRIVAIDRHCMTLPAFAETQPERCPDAE